MTLEVVGAFMVALALIGGGLQIFNAHIPHLSKIQLVALGLVGVLFIAIGIGTDLITSPAARETGQSQTTE
jgi:divalent metal cation (Fe/Co/Zn/Cd) transporter